MDFLSAGMKKSGRCREVLNKSQCMDFLSAGMEKSGHGREVAVSRGLTGTFGRHLRETNRGGPTKCLPP